MSSASDTIVLAAFIRAVRSVGVGEKECIDPTTLQDLCKIDPVLEVSLRAGAVLGVLQKRISTDAENLKT